MRRRQRWHSAIIVAIMASMVLAADE